MADAPESTAGAPPKGKGKKKILGLPVPVALGGAALLATLGYLWWRKRHPAGAATASAATGTASADVAAELAAMQGELNQLLGQGAGGGGGGTTGTPTGTKPDPDPKTAANPVRGLHTTDIGYTSVTLAWEPAKGATDYLVTALHGESVLKSEHTPGTMARVGSLKRGTSYEFRVRAQPGGKGGTDAKVSVTTKGGHVVVNPGGPMIPAKK